MVDEIKKVFKSSDDTISMFIGLALVIVAGVLIFNFVERRKGNISLPGVSTYLKIDNESIDTNKEEGGETGVVKGEDSVVVQKGDSLWKIAENKYGDGYKWTEIAKANNLKNPSFLAVGQKLILPVVESTVIGEEKGTSQNTESFEYQVVKGDTLWSIAVRTTGDGYQWVKIWQANRSKLNSPDKLEIGMMLTVYGKI